MGTDGTTAFGNLVRSVGGVKSLARNAAYGAAALAVVSGFSSWCVDAHYRSVAELRESALRIARMQAEGRLPRVTAYAMRDVAKASLMRTFAGRDATAGTGLGDAELFGSVTGLGERVDRETANLRRIVAEVETSSPDPSTREAMVEGISRASERVREEMRRQAQVAVDDGLAGERMAKLYAVDSALETLVRGMASGVDGRRLAASPGVRTAMSTEPNPRPSPVSYGY